MTIIKQEDLIESVAAALQYISYYHPADYIEHLARAYESEQSPAAKDAIAQILTNSRMCAEGKRPICQDTGIVNVFLKIGMGVRFEGFSGTVTDAQHHFRMHFINRRIQRVNRFTKHARQLPHHNLRARLPALRHPAGHAQTASRRPSK